MKRVVFGPGWPVGRVLTVALVGFSGFWAYAWICIGPTCDPDRITPGLMLFCGVLIALGLLCWWWQPIRVHVELDEEGITFQCAGMTLVPRRKLNWDQVAAFGWRQFGKGQYFDIEARPEGDQTRGRTYELLLTGFSAKPDAVVAAAVPFMQKAGYRLDTGLRHPMFLGAHVRVVPTAG